MQVGFFRPLGHWHYSSRFEMRASRLESKSDSKSAPYEQFALLKLTYSQDEYQSDEDKESFFSYCEKTLQSDHPDFRIVKGLLFLAFTYHKRAKQEEKSPSDMSDYFDAHDVENLKAEKIRLEKILLKLVKADSSNNTIQGMINFALYLVTKNPSYLVIAIEMENREAIFFVAGEQFGLFYRDLLSEGSSEHKKSSEKSILLDQILNLVEKAADLEYPPACLLLGLGLIVLVKPDFNLNFKFIIENDTRLAEFLGDMHLSQVVSQAVPLLTQKFKNSSKQKPEHSQHFNSKIFTQFFNSPSTENAIERFAIELLEIAARKGSHMAIRSLIMCFAAQNNVAQTIDYLLKCEENEGFHKWVSLGIAFRDGGYLDLTQFGHANPLKWEFASPDAPSEMKLNIDKNPQKAIFCLKRLFRLIVNNHEVAWIIDNHRYLLELPLSFCHGKDSVYPNSCIPQDAAQATELLKIAAYWAAKMQYFVLHDEIINIFRKGEGCLSPMPELVDELEAQYAKLKAEYDKNDSEGLSPSVVDALNPDSDEDAVSSEEFRARFLPRS